MGGYSRVIAAAKAATAVGLGTPPGANPNTPAGLALSTANLYASAQPGGSLWGVPFANATNAAAAYAGNRSAYGTNNDPMLARRIGGHITFGGGLALYDDTGELVGGLGVSGDSSCKDHNYAWQVRHALVLDYVPAGPNSGSDALRPDNIIYDMGSASQGNIVSPSGFGHVICDQQTADIAATLPPVRIVGDD